MESFETAATFFERFIAQQGYPPHVLWLDPDDVVFWRLRYYFRTRDISEHVRRAKAKYEEGLSRNHGIALQAHAMTERWALCGIYIPMDSMDAECRMIPKNSVKVAVSSDPKPATEVNSRIQWRLLRWLARTDLPYWD